MFDKTPWLDNEVRQIDNSTKALIIEWMIEKHNESINKWLNITENGYQIAMLNGVRVTINKLIQWLQWLQNTTNINQYWILTGKKIDNTIDNKLQSKKITWLWRSKK